MNISFSTVFFSTFERASSVKNSQQNFPQYQSNACLYSYKRCKLKIAELILVFNINPFTRRVKKNALSAKSRFNSDDSGNYEEIYVSLEGRIFFQRISALTSL